MAFSHRLKRLDFLGRRVTIVLQNENGPCALLGLVNALLLSNAITIHEDYAVVDSDQIIGMIANHLIETNPPHENPDVRANQQKAIDDVIKLLPSLQYGLDVNVNFTSVQGFEYNPGIALFDMFDIKLYHGWLVDPSAEETYAVVKDLSYNRLMDMAISGQDAEDESVRHSAQVCKTFLEENPSQLTYYGLHELYKGIKERQLAVFFRNNHFSTIFKLNGDLFMLVTDLGYEKQDSVAWETLAEINGNTDMVSPSFGNPNEYIPPEDLKEPPPRPEKTSEADRQLALQLQREEQAGGGGNNRRGSTRRQGRNNNNNKSCTIS